MLLTGEEDLAHRIFSEIWAQGRLETAEEVFSPDCTHHFFDQLQPDKSKSGPEGYRQIVRLFHSAFPEPRIDFEIEENGYTRVYWTLTAVHSGFLLDVPPSGARVTLSGVELLRIREGRVQETWEFLNLPGVKKRLSALASQESFC